MKLYIFITHKRNIDNCYDRINNMMSELGLDFIIIQGGFIKDSYNQDTKILSLNCNDSYVGLQKYF
jgi:hypothetical protein